MTWRDGLSWNHYHITFFSERTFSLLRRAFLESMVGTDEATRTWPGRPAPPSSDPAWLNEGRISLANPLLPEIMKTFIAGIELGGTRIKAPALDSAGNAGNAAGRMEAIS